MKLPIPTLFQAVLIVSLFTPTSVVYAKMYRWVDEQGNVFYSDKVPPESNKYKRDALSDSARVLETTEAEKSKDEIDLNNRLSRLRRQQEKVLKEQDEQDKVLLNTFRTEEDIRRALQEKLASLESKKKVSQGDLKRLQFQLQGQQKVAAGYELKGKKVPKSLLTEISETEKQIGLVNDNLARLELKSMQTEDKFNKDIKRFNLLMEKNQQKTLSVKTPKPEKVAMTELGVFTCVDKTHCSSAWEVARLYIQNHSTTEIELDNKKLIIASDPIKADDISLSVSKIKNSAGQDQIFLDIKCYPGQAGTQLCLSEKVRTIRADFAPFVKALLAPN